jgi:predicted transcriptional regulator
MQQLVTTNTEGAERFETAFNRIHKCLVRLVRNAKTDSFKNLLDEGKSHAIIRTYHHDLTQYAKLRNALVHEKIQERFYIAEPHEKIVTHIEYIANHFEQPMAALSIATKPVMHYKEDTPLKDVLRVVDSLSYAQYPIYDRHGMYGWLLTTKGILRWLSRQSLTGISLEKILVKDVRAFEHPHEVKFVDRHMDIYEVEELFEDHHLAKKKLEAVIVTHNGKKEEKPLGIITAWDLVEIDALEQQLQE